MKKILFLTNYPSPYRVNFYDALGKYFELTVLFSDRLEDIHHRDRAWFESGKGGFQGVQLKAVAQIGEEYLCPDVLSWVKKPYDAYVICGYSSPTMILAMGYLRMRGIPFYMEVDGGIIRQESRAKFLLKRALVGMANSHLSTGKHTTDFLVHYGAQCDRVREYPFSSLWERDILPNLVTWDEKMALRRELQIPQTRMVLSIGQFIHRKGFDVLLKAAASVPEDVGFTIIGGEETEQYRQLRQQLGLRNIHFLGFQKKEQLKKYFMAADVFVLPTREDIWGLVINEAMAYGLPVITTDRCVAGLELVTDGVNGYLVPTDDPQTLADRLCRILTEDLVRMGQASLDKIRPYTLENMVKTHVQILEGEK